LRVVSIQGLNAIDPEQTTIPSAWKKLPTYRLRYGDTMVLREKRRGNSNPPLDELRLKRDLWLDCNGQGFTLSDQISGKFNQSWRLEMNQEIDLGRVAINNKDQFITYLKNDDQKGVEVRQGKINVNADSRYNGDVSNIPAVGWAHDFHKVQGNLHLPPGWRLFHASGVDSVSKTWIKTWSLLDLFLMLLLALAMGKLFSWWAGGIALLVFVLIFPEPNAPQWVWVFVFSFIGLSRVLPNGLFQQATKIVNVFMIALVAIISLPFMVQQIRQAMYPTLEYSWQSMDSTITLSNPRGGSSWPGTAAKAPQPVKQQEMQVMNERDDGIQQADVPQASQPQPMVKQKFPQKQVILSKVERKRARRSRLLAGKSEYSQISTMERKQLAHDPKAMVQTGPGLPQWKWNIVSLNWSGPVDQTQRINFHFISPKMNFILALLRVLALGLLILLTVQKPKSWRGLLKGGAISLVFVGALLMPGIAKAK